MSSLAAPRPPDHRTVSLARPPCWSSSSTPPVAVDSTTAGPRRHHRPAPPPRSAIVSEPRRNGSLSASGAPRIEAKRPPLFSNGSWRYLSPWRLAYANGRMVTTGGPSPGPRCQGEVGGEHAEEHVRSDPVFEVVVNRPQVDVFGFHRAAIRTACLRSSGGCLLDRRPTVPSSCQEVEPLETPGTVHTQTRHRPRLQAGSQPVRSPAWQWIFRNSAGIGAVLAQCAYSGFGKDPANQVAGSRSGQVIRPSGRGPRSLPAPRHRISLVLGAEGEERHG